MARRSLAKTHKGGRKSANASKKGGHKMVNGKSKNGKTKRGGGKIRRRSRRNKRRSRRNRRKGGSGIFGWGDSSSRRMPGRDQPSMFSKFFSPRGNREVMAPGEEDMQYRHPGSSGNTNSRIYPDAADPYLKNPSDRDYGRQIETRAMGGVERRMGRELVNRGSGRSW